MKPIITNQWAAPDPGPLEHPGVAEDLDQHRPRALAALRSNRSGSGWPSRTTANIWRTTRTTSATATTVMPAASTVETIWTAPMPATSPIDTAACSR